MLRLILKIVIDCCSSKAFHVCFSKFWKPALQKFKRKKQQDIQQNSRRFVAFPIMSSQH